MVNKSLPSEKLRKHAVPFAGVAGCLKRKNFVQACIRVCPGFARTRRPGACGGLVELRPGALRGGRARSSDRTVARCVGRTSALLVSRRRAQLPVGAVIVGGQTMFMPPPTKKARQPLMSGQRDVCARAGAAPTGAAATGGVPTPLREEPWPTRPQISVHCDSPSPSPGHDRGRFAAVFGSPQASLRPWPSSMVAAVPGWVLETPPPSFAGRAPVCALSWYVGVR